MVIKPPINTCFSSSGLLDFLQRLEIYLLCSSLVRLPLPISGLNKPKQLHPKGYFSCRSSFSVPPILGGDGGKGRWLSTAVSSPALAEFR